MSWKRVIVGSGQAAGQEGRVLPQDLETTGLVNNATPGTGDIGKVLKIMSTSNGGQMEWQADEVYVHPTNYAGDDIDVDTGNLTGATVISDLDINVETDSQGHVVDANGSVATRTMSLADLGYTGVNDANNYVHPNDYDGDGGANAATQEVNEVLTGNQVIRGLELKRTVNSKGHVTDHKFNATVGILDLADLGYTGDPNADQYDNWKLEVGGQNSVNITSAQTVDFVAGANMSVSSTSTGQGVTLTWSANPAGIGKVEQVAQGGGMAFSTINSGNPDGVISMAMPLDVSTSSVNNTGAAGAGHSHRIVHTSDGSSDTGSTSTVLSSSAQGGLKIQHLEIADSITVSGQEVILGSAEVQIEDESIQINYDTAGGAAYNTGSSAILFGHSTATQGGKIINHVDSGSGTHFMAITDLNAGADFPADGGGSTTFGTNTKSLKCGPIVSDGRIIADKVEAEGLIKAGTDLDISNTLTFDSISEPASSSSGEMYFDGASLWVNIEA